MGGGIVKVLVVGIIEQRSGTFCARVFDKDAIVAYGASLAITQRNVVEHYSKLYRRQKIEIKFERCSDGIKYIISKQSR